MSGRLFLVAALIAAPAAAQFETYTAPGALALTSAPTKAVVEEAMQQAPWRLGPVRLAPWLTLRDLTYYRNTGLGRGSDLSATVAAGLQGYLPFGEHVILGAYALPEYVWWKDNSAQRRWNGRYGAGFFVYLNRLTLEMRAGRDQSQQWANSELDRPVTLRDDHGDVRAELRILQRFSLFGEAATSRYRYKETDVLIGPDRPLSVLDHDERRGGGGVMYRPRSDIAIGLGYEHVATEFSAGPNDLSSSGDGPFVEFHLKGSSLALDGRIARVTLDPRAGSAFEPFRGRTGHAALTWTSPGQWEWSVYSGRSLAFSFLVHSAYYLDDRNGVSLLVPVGWRTKVRGFHERGSNTYSRTIGGDPGFRDNFHATGFEARFAMGTRSTLIIGSERTTYDRALATRGRDVTRYTARIQLGRTGMEWW